MGRAPRESVFPQTSKRTQGFFLTAEGEMRMKSVGIEILVGKVVREIENLEVGKGYDQLITFSCTDGSEFGMKYDPDCCASCSIEDIIGDPKDLLNSPILMAEEVSSNNPDEKTIAERREVYEKRKAEQGEDFYSYGPSPENGWKDESETWTFYKLSTIKGSVTIRWYGSSNGYYSESASFYDLNQKESWQ
jgi:hypothetical protein